MAVNPWLEEKLKKIESPEWLNLIVEVKDPARVEAVTGQLRLISGVSIGRQAFNMIEITAPTGMVARIEAIPGVTVHYNMPKRIAPLPIGRLTSIIDPLIGEVRIDNIIVPREKLKPDLLLPFSPLRFLSHHGPLGDVEMIPTERSRNVILDIPTVLTGRGVAVAILDTGAATLNPQCLGVIGSSTCSSDPLPMDFHGHGSWCLNAATGRKARGIFGTVLGVAPEAKQISIKVLHGVFGFGTEMDIIKGIERAVQMGAKVISMSLGGDECQGGEANCPECRIIDELSKGGIIFCIAAGNSGPEGWQIGCPGCAAGAITVGSVSMTDYPQPAYFSSRGPSNIMNQGGTYDFKPDILAPGGGRALITSEPDEVLYSGEEGYMKSLYSGVGIDIAGAFHGTSQATPHIAGLCAILVEKGYNSAEEIKAVFRTKGHEKRLDSGWGIAKLSWFA